MPLIGTGEHIYLHVEKRGENTDWVAQQIAQLAGVKPLDIGYAGLKDRHAVTRQWFSIYFPKGNEPDWSLLNSDTVTLLEQTRHKSKLRRGEHASNSFIITLKNLRASGDVQVKPYAEARLASIRQHGVPNYFGEQRFGRQGHNLPLAERWFVEGDVVRKRSLKGLVLSAARSYLFNRVLAARLEAGSWNEFLAGDVDTQGPTGPLWGRGRSLVSDATLALESAALAGFELWRDGLEHQGLSQERRPLVLPPQALRWEWSAAGDLVLSFTLPPGTYATTVMRELCELENRASPVTSSP